jgi:hypothetical protein
MLLKGIETAIDPDHFMKVFGMAPMDPEEPSLLSQARIMGDNHASVSEGAKILRWKEGEASEISHLSGLLLRCMRLKFIFSPKGLGCVFDNKEMPRRCNPEDRIHISTLSIEMNRNDGFCP